MSMENVRKEIEEMSKLGLLPSEQDTDLALLKKFDELHRAIIPPITDEEARILTRLFGSDGCFGLASTFIHLIETAPGWPLMDCLLDQDNEWIVELRNRAIRGGRLHPEN